MRTPFVVLALAACSASSDIDGPITGTQYLYTVDSIALPIGPQGLGDDLDGNGTIDDQLGTITLSISQQEDLTTHGADMIDSGAITSTVEIETPSLLDGTNAGVWYFGVVGGSATAAEGAFAGGELESNRTRATTNPGAAILSLPIFEDADPTVVTLHEMEIDLMPDAASGFYATVRGGIDPDEAKMAAAPGIAQMIAADPKEHVGLDGLVDMNHDGVISAQEIEASNFIASLLAPDITLSGKQYISAAFTVHLVPCIGAGCVQAPAEPCFDRVRDGDETGVDCGGATCAARCPGGQACATGSDCQTGQCNAGTCTAPSCSDGIEDGFETGIDCGGTCIMQCF